MAGRSSRNALQDGVRVPIGAKIQATGAAQPRSSASSDAFGQPSKKKDGKGDGKGSWKKGKSRHKGSNGKGDKASYLDSSDKDPFEPEVREPSKQDEEEDDALIAGMNQWIEAATGPRVVQPPSRDATDSAMDMQDLATASDVPDRSMVPESTAANVEPEDVDAIEEESNSKVTLEETVRLAAGPSMRSWVEWVENGEEGNYVIQAKIVCEKDGVPLKKMPLQTSKPYQFVYIFGGGGATKLEAQCVAAKKALEKAKALLPKLREAKELTFDEEMFFLAWCELVEVKEQETNGKSQLEDAGETQTSVVKTSLAVAKSSIAKGVVAKSTVNKMKLQFQPAPKKNMTTSAEQSCPEQKNDDMIVHVVAPQPPASPPPAALLGQAQALQEPIRTMLPKPKLLPVAPKLLPVAKHVPAKANTPTESFTKAAAKAKVDDKATEANSGSDNNVPLKPGLLPQPNSGGDINVPFKPSLLPQPTSCGDATAPFKPSLLPQQGKPGIINSIPTFRFRPSLPTPKNVPDENTMQSVISGTSVSSSSSTSIAPISGTTIASSSSSSSNAVQPKHMFAAFMRPPIAQQVPVQSFKQTESWARSAAAPAEPTAPPTSAKLYPNMPPKESDRAWTGTVPVPAVPAWDSWGQEEGTDESSASTAVGSSAKDDQRTPNLHPGLNSSDPQQLSHEAIVTPETQRNQHKAIADRQSGTNEKSSTGHQPSFVGMLQHDSKVQPTPVKMPTNLNARTCATPSEAASALKQPSSVTLQKTPNAHTNVVEGYRQSAWHGNPNSQTSHWAERGITGQTPSSSSFVRPLNGSGAGTSVNHASLGSSRVSPQASVNVFATSIGQSFVMPASGPLPRPPTSDMMSPSGPLPKLPNGSVGESHLPAFPPGLSQGSLHLDLSAGVSPSAPSTSLGTDGMSQPLPKLLDIPPGPSFAPPPPLPAKAPPRKPPGPPPGLPPGVTPDFRNRPTGTFADTSRPEGKQISRRESSRSRSRSAGRNKGSREDEKPAESEERALALVGQVESKRALEDIDGRSQGQKSAKTRRAEVLPGNWRLLKHTVDGMFRHGDRALFNFSLELRVFEDEWVAIPVIGAQTIVADWEVFRAADTGVDNAGLPQWRPMQLGSDTLWTEIRESDREDGQACEEHNLVTNTSGWYKITFHAYIRVRKDGTAHSFELNLLYPISATQLRLVHDTGTRIKEFSVEPAAFFEIKDGDSQSEVDIKLPSTKTVEVKWQTQARAAAVELPLPGVQAGMPQGDKMQEMAQAMALEMLKRLNGQSLQDVGGSTPLPAVSPEAAAQSWDRRTTQEAWPRHEQGRQWHATSGKRTEDL